MDLVTTATRTGAIAALMLVTGAIPAATQGTQDSGQGSCAARDHIVDQLGEQFQESQQAVGVVGEDAVLEVYSSPSGTWTIITTDTAGNSCIMAAGQGWDDDFEAAEALEGAGA